MMQIVTCYFNPQKYHNLRENYWRFREALHLPLLTIELSFDGIFDIFDADVKITGGPQNVMWQKERLLNLLVETLPPEVDKIAWVDADVLFLRNKWWEAAEGVLETHKAVQLFEHAHFLDPLGRVIRTRDSWASKIGSKEPVMSAPGFAWAARRELFPLIDHHICGGGDKLMCEAWLGNYNAMGRQMNKVWLTAFAEESRRQYEYVKGSIAFLKGDIVHLWHGSFNDRKYVERWLYLTDNQFDPRVDIVHGDNGIWQWATDKPKMHASIAGYFAERREDG